MPVISTLESDGEDLVAEDSDDSIENGSWITYSDKTVADLVGSPTTRQSVAARGVGDSLLFLHNDEHHSMAIGARAAWRVFATEWSPF